LTRANSPCLCSLMDDWNISTNRHITHKGQWNSATNSLKLVSSITYLGIFISQSPTSCCFRKYRKAIWIRVGASSGKGTGVGLSVPKILYEDSLEENLLHEQKESARGWISSSNALWMTNASMWLWRVKGVSVSTRQQSSQLYWVHSNPKLDIIWQDNFFARAVACAPHVVLRTDHSRPRRTKIINKRTKGYYCTTGYVLLRCTERCFW
jgi:hypothetical protein